MSIYVNRLNTALFFRLQATLRDYKQNNTGQLFLFLNSFSAYFRAANDSDFKHYKAHEEVPQPGKVNARFDNNDIKQSLPQIGEGFFVSL